MALKKGVESGFLKQIKGIGASGSFVLSEGKAVKTAEFTKKVKMVKPKKAKAPAKTTGVKKSPAKKVTPKRKPPGKKVAPEKATPTVAKPAVATPSTVAVTTPPAAKKTKSTKSAKKAKSPKKLNVAKKLPAKKAIFIVHRFWLFINISNFYRHRQKNPRVQRSQKHLAGKSQLKSLLLELQLQRGAHEWRTTCP